jgi:hypothetical protein
MVPALIAPCSPQLSPHLTVGCSTGFMAERRGDWPALVAEAARNHPFAIELAALGEPELPALLEYLAATPSLPFLFLSVHAPSKHREMTEEELVGMLGALTGRVDAIVVHPDTIEDPSLYRSLGRCLALENMDVRKSGGRSVDELAPLFAELPDAGLCFDVAHAKSVEPAMAEGERILAAFGNRLRHVHLSSLDAHCHHVPLTAADERLFAPLLSQCRDVPWILEAPLTRS